MLCCVLHCSLEVSFDNFFKTYFLGINFFSYVNFYKGILIPIQSPTVSTKKPNDLLDDLNTLAQN